jgi:uncharacterized protein (UPF0248 family)
MIPIQELLNRIRWDKEFGKGTFEIGYYDHIEQEIIRVPFKEMHFEKGNHFSFQLENNESEMVTIPFHRVRKVYKDGDLIWHRSR